MKSIMLRFVAAAVFGLACSVATFAQGGTITIQGQAGTFPTIQSAIDAVPQAGTVIVDGGDHQENLVITKAVQLLGQNNAAINPPTGNPIFVNNASGSVQIISFTIKVPSGQIGVFYDADAAASHTGTILRCTFTGGLHSVFAKEGNFRIVSNKFNNFTATAVVAQGVAGTTNRQLRVSSNIFTGSAVSGGVVVQLVSSAITVVDGTIQVDGNQISNVKNGVFITNCLGKVTTNNLTNAQVGMDVNNAPSLLIERNSDFVSATFAAAYNAQAPGFTVSGIFLKSSSGAIIRNNTIAGGNSGIIITSQSAGVTVDANIVRDVIGSPLGGGAGISVTNGSSAEIHNNNIENNVTGVVTFNAGIVNATNNWWGAANGPGGAGGGSGNSVNNGVIFAPFLIAPNPNAGA